MDISVHNNFRNTRQHLIFFSILFFGFILSGCSVKTALLVKVANNPTPLIGEAVATLTEGTFMVENMNGFRCNGTYNQWETSPLLKVHVTCNDGRYGDVTVIRSGSSKQNGSGEGVLNDGTAFRVYMGDLATSELWKHEDDIKKTIIK